MYNPKTSEPVLGTLSKRNNNMHKNIIDAKATQLLNEELIQDQFSLTPSEESALTSLYNEHGTVFGQGQLFTGKVLSKSGNGVVVDVAFKSYGTIPNS